jgi:hypothetical protein
VLPVGSASCAIGVSHVFVSQTLACSVFLAVDQAISV